MMASTAKKKPMAPVCRKCGRRLVAILSRAYGSLVTLDLPEVSPGSIFTAMLAEQSSFVSSLFHHAGIYDLPAGPGAADVDQAGDDAAAAPADDEGGSEAE